MNGRDYRANLPRPNELKVLSALTKSPTDAQSIVGHSGVDLTHVYTYLGRMGRLGYVVAKGTIRARLYGVTALGRKAMKIAAMAESLQGAPKKKKKK
ncbi:MAG: hypothetical protein RJA70_220 [Pseudomonadota bacterium]|jgi:DNA-binding IclR family transcriptional regulator